jgi:hypothetical protein
MHARAIDFDLFCIEVDNQFAGLNYKLGCPFERRTIA